MKHNMLENMFKYYLNALIEKKNILRFNVFAEWVELRGNIYFYNTYTNIAHVAHNMFAYTHYINYIIIDHNN